MAPTESATGKPLGAKPQASAKQVWTHQRLRRPMNQQAKQLARPAKQLSLSLAGQTVAAGLSKPSATSGAPSHASLALAAGQPKSPSAHVQRQDTNQIQTQETNITLSMSNQTNWNQINSQRPQLRIKRALNLGYVKSLVLVLMGVDLLISVLMHQLAQEDLVNLWWVWPGGLRLRLSLLNLVLSGLWFVLLAAAVLYDLYAILLVSSCLHSGSFLLLLGLSIYHFSRRIDYSSVHLASLLALLFALALLHVYLIAMAALTVYLMLIVRRRHRNPKSSPTL